MRESHPGPAYVTCLGPLRVTQQRAVAGIYTGPVSLTAATMFFSEVLILKLLLW